MKEVKIFGPPNQFGICPHIDTIFFDNDCDNDYIYDAIFNDDIIVNDNYHSQCSIEIITE